MSVVKISPEWVTGPEQGKSSGRIATFSLWTTTPILDKLLEYKINWMQHVNRMPRNRLPRVMKHYFPTGRRNYGRALKRLLDTWDRNGSTSGPSPWNMMMMMMMMNSENVGEFLPSLYFFCYSLKDILYLTVYHSWNLILAAKFNYCLADLKELERKMN